MPFAIPELEVLPDAAAVAERVAQRLLQARSHWPALPLGLATGRTMEPVYGALVRRIEALPSQERQPLLAGWLSFNLDEYVGQGPADAGSFAAAMERHLAGPLGLSSQQVRLPDGLALDADAEAHRYGDAVAACGGIGLQLLGLGLNGHVGFNEPPCCADAPSRCVRLSEATRSQNAAGFGGDAAAVPERAISLGMREILGARAVLLVVTGAAKAAILRRSLEDPPAAAVPASWLQQHPQLSVIVDVAAAVALQRCNAVRLTA